MLLCRISRFGARLKNKKEAQKNKEKKVKVACVVSFLFLFFKREIISYAFLQKRILIPLDLPLCNLFKYSLFKLNRKIFSTQVSNSLQK
jgi:hypothetical protein